MFLQLVATFSFYFFILLLDLTPIQSVGIFHLVLLDFMSSF